MKEERAKLMSTGNEFISAFQGKVFCFRVETFHRNVGESVRGMY